MAHDTSFESCYLHELNNFQQKSDFKFQKGVLRRLASEGLGFRQSFGRQALERKLLLHLDRAKCYGYR
jgi:hypothetical protein